jgi:hypothetical protein
MLSIYAKSVASSEIEGARVRGRLTGNNTVGDPELPEDQ